MGPTVTLDVTEERYISCLCLDSNPRSSSL